MIAAGIAIAEVTLDVMSYHTCSRVNAVGSPIIYHAVEQGLHLSRSAGGEFCHVLAAGPDIRAGAMQTRLAGLAIWIETWPSAV